MAAFLLKWKLRGRPNRNRSDETVKGSRIIAGSRPLADLYVSDRLVAEEAIAFEFDGFRLAIDTLAERGGVFVDGHPVNGRGPVPSGATVQFGGTLVEVSIDNDAKLCTLEVNEQYLPSMIDGVVKKAKPEVPFSLEESGPQEHRWGKHPILRRANWVALAVGALALLSFFALQDTEAMSRGELADWHQVGKHESGKHPGSKTVQSCTDCHTPFNSNYAPVCATCHPGFDSTATHPFDQADQFTCSHCHMDHRGGTYDLMPPMDAAHRNELGEPLFCGDCHDFRGAAMGALDDATLQGLVAKRSGGRDAPPKDPVVRVLEVDGFSHADHRIDLSGKKTSFAGPDTRGQVPVACADCHKPMSDESLVNPSQASSNVLADFALVTYEQCLECHADWRLKVPHGRDEQGQYCHQCHSPGAGGDPQLITADIRTAEIPATEMKYVLKPRQHDFRSDECLRCHVLEKQDVGGKTSIAQHVFRHDHHLTTLTPTPGTELTLTETCKTCHKSMAASDQMPGTKLVDFAWGGDGKVAGCGSCHTEGDPVAVAVPAASKRRVVDMFHSVHTLDAQQLASGATRSRGSRETLSKGCMACHVPTAGQQRMSFVPKTEDCSSCHTGHENIGQGKCVLCHVDRTPEVNRRINGRLEFRFQEAGIFNRDKAVKKDTVALPRFDHFSRGHVDHKCAECHDNDVVDKSERVIEVPWPAYNEASCIRCHLRERYHW